MSTAPLPVAARPAHSEWGASGAHRWMVCAGSIRQSRGIPDQTSIYADEGTVAHGIGEACLLNNDRNPADFIGQKLKGDVHEFTVTEEMAEAVAVYVNTVRTDRLLLGGELWVEHKFDISPIVADVTLPEGGSPPLYGRNDVCLFVPNDGQLIVYDYKHGAGHAVEVDMNPQLLYYALGAVLENDKKRKYRIKTIEIVVVQPRAAHRDGPIRRFSILLVDLLEWAADLIAAVKRTIAPNAPLTAGDHCLFCRAAPTCPELHRVAQETAMVEFGRVHSQPPAVTSLTMDQLRAVLAKADMVEQFISDVRNHLHGLAASGIHVPGYKLVPKRAYRHWVSSAPDTTLVVRQIADAVAPGAVSITDLYTEPELRSPAQVEEVLKKAKVLKNKEAKQIFDNLYVKKSSGTTLAPDGDARIAVSPPAVTDFAHLAIAGNPMD